MILLWFLITMFYGCQFYLCHFTHICLIQNRHQCLMFELLVINLLCKMCKEHAWSKGTGRIGKDFQDRPRSCRGGNQLFHNGNSWFLSWRNTWNNGKITQKKTKIPFVARRKRFWKISNHIQNEFPAAVNNEVWLMLRLNSCQLSSFSASPANGETATWSSKAEVNGRK